MEDQTPTVGRPRGAAWRALQADGVVWEGQVYIVGAELDLAARLIVTRRRIAFARGGGIALETARAWLRPAPSLRPDGALTLYVQPDESAEPSSLVVRFRDGRRAAAHVVSLLAGSGVRPVLPPSRSEPATTQPPEPEAPTPAAPGPEAEAARPRWQSSPAAERFLQRSAEPSADLPPVPPLPPVMPVHLRDDEEPAYLPAVSEGQQRHHWRIWALRLSGLIVLLALAAVAAWYGSDRIVSTLREHPKTPTTVAAGNLVSTRVPSAVVAQGSETPASNNGTTAQSATTLPGTTEQQAAQSQGTGGGPTYTAAEETAAALGVGGSTEAGPPPTPLQTPAPPEETAAVVAPIPTATATPPPAPTATLTPAPTATLTPAPTNTPLPPTATATAVPPTQTPTPAPTATATPQPTVAPTSTPEPTSTPVPPTATATPQPTATATATSAPTATATPQPTATSTPLPPTSTATPIPPTPTPVPPTPTPTLTVPVGGTLPPQVVAPSAAPTSTPTPAPTATATPEPTATATPQPTATATLQPTATPPPPTATAIPQPTATATPEPTPTATPQPTQTPTQTPTPAPTATATSQPAATATPQPTVMPTELPASPVATTAPMAPAATMTPTVPTAASPVTGPSPTPESPFAQAPTVPKDTTPEQVFVNGAYRFTVESALRGTEIPELELGPTANGSEWVVLVVQARNQSDQPAILSMSDFELLADGQLIPLDASSGQMATFLGFVPVYQSTTRVLFAPDEAHRVALVFQAPPNATNLSLLSGQSAISLDPAFTDSAEITDLGSSPAAPQLLEAKVTQVIDGQTIEVEIDGQRQRVRYLGVTAPTGNACGAAAATTANTNLMTGQTVWLERQQSDKDGQGDLLRDVWIADQGGVRVLAAARLAIQGAVLPDPVEPNIRYAGWIAAAAASAQYQGLGLYTNCGVTPPPAANVTSSDAVTPAADQTGQANARQQSTDQTAGAGDADGGAAIEDPPVATSPPIVPVGNSASDAQAVAYHISRLRWNN